MVTNPIWFLINDWYIRKMLLRKYTDLYVGLKSYWRDRLLTQRGVMIKISEEGNLRERLHCPRQL